jgi:hypothetical protein
MCESKLVEEFAMTRFVNKNSLVKRGVMIMLVIMALVGTLSISASAIQPTSPYFYTDAALTQLPPMGNSTVGDIETDKTNYYFFFQPEFFREPYTGDYFVGTISSVQVYNYSTSTLDTLVLSGGSVVVPASYVHVDTVTNTAYIQFTLGVTAFDITTGTPYSHLPIPPVYFDATKLP